LAFTPDRSRIYTVGTGGLNATVSVIDTTTGAVASTISGFKNPQSLAVSPDGTRD
jgi:YVTN family beta-propeller protein